MIKGAPGGNRLIRRQRYKSKRRSVRGMTRFASNSSTRQVCVPLLCNIPILQIQRLLTMCNQPVAGKDWHIFLSAPQVAQPYSTAGLSTEDVQYNDASRPSNSPGKDDAQHSRLLLGQSVRQLPADAFVQSKKDLAGSTHRQPTQDLLQETDADYDTSYIEGSNFGGFESDLEEDQMEGHTRSQKDSASPASAPVRDELVVELFEQRSMLLSAIMESTACR